MKSNAMSASKHHSSWQWWFGALVAVVAFAFGATGLWQYEVEHGVEPDAVSVVYHTLQLFILHAPHLEHAAPWQLHVGRLLAAGLVFAAATKAFLKVFRDELLQLRLWLPWQRGHVVVCGLGDLGLRLALDGRRRGRFVVAIEKDPAPGTLEQARASGVLVLEGDGRDAARLRQARVERAEFLVAACKDDQTNVAIAALAGQYAQPNKKRPAPLVCRLMIQDPKLRALVSDEALFPHTGSSYRVNFSDLDLEDTAARQAFRQYPLDFETIGEDDDTVVHLVLIGFGEIGQSLALHAARIGHFANEAGKRRKRLYVTVVDKDQNAGWEMFVSRYKNLQQVCDADFAVHEPGDAGFVAAMAALCPAAGAFNALVTYAICIESDDQSNLGLDRTDDQTDRPAARDDQANLRLGLELSKLTTNRPAQVLIHQTSKRGFAALFPQKGRGSGLSDRIHAFGMEDDLFSWDTLLHEGEDRVARALHEYFRASTEEGAHPDWDHLAESYKESNRQAADHIPIKLRALGYRDCPLRGPNTRIEYFNEKEVELLSKMEHARWCAERLLAGWQYGKPTVRERKINECLVPWNQLEEKDKKKDWSQIKAIPKILYSVGRGIYQKES